MLQWALLADVVPLYPLYALLFADTGLSGAEISALFAIWSAVGILAEVPSGALADRLSRRGCLVWAGVLQAMGYTAWLLLPGFAGFALGFVLWGLGGALVSGAREALLFDGLKAGGAAERYGTINGWVVALGLLAQIPTAAVATALFAAGGYPLAGWVSVGTCLAAAWAASRIPEAPRSRTEDRDDDLGYLATLCAGLADAAATRGVLGVLAAAAMLGAVDTVEEYFPLLLAEWGLPLAAIPLAALPIILAGAAGAALGGRAGRIGVGSLAALLAAAMLVLGAAGLAAHPAGTAAVALFYGAYRAVLVVVDARLQERITSRSRATVTSVAGVGVDVATFGFLAVWALGGAPLMALVGVLLAAALPRLLRPRPIRSRRDSAY
jgi:MFS family permease